jgi:hypothetical protein
MNLPSATGTSRTLLWHLSNAVVHVISQPFTPTRSTIGPETASQPTGPIEVLVGQHICLNWECLYSAGLPAVQEVQDGSVCDAVLGRSSESVLRNRSNLNVATYLPETDVEASLSDLPYEWIDAALLIPITRVLSITYNRHDGYVESLRDTEHLSIRRYKPIPTYASHLLEGVGVSLRPKADEPAPDAPFEILAPV